MSASITKGPAFEIRFCEGNKVQVFDLSKKGDQSGNQLLPNEYLEDDVVNGRLRYSKLGNQWLSDDAGTHQQTLAAIPDDQQKRTNIQKKTDDNLDIIPVVAKRKAIEDAKELESIRQGEEAMRKAMERKKKIEMVRRAREQAAAAKEEGTTAITESSMTATVATTNQNNDTQEGPTAKNKDYRDTNMESKNEQDPQYQFEHEKDLTFATEMNSNGRIAKTNQNSALILDNNHLPASPIPNRLPRTDSASIRDSGNSVNTDNSNRKDRPSPVQKVPSFTSYMTTTTPVPPRTTSSSPIEHPAPAHTQKQPISQHYYPQQQHPKHHEYTIPQNQPSYELPLEDSFFHPDNSSDKNKPASSSSCCCIIS